MKKIIFVIPLMTLSLLASCNNNRNEPKEYFDCYSRLDYYNLGLPEYFELYEYNDMHLPSKVLGYTYARSSLQEIGSEYAITCEYNNHAQITKRNSVWYRYDKSGKKVELKSIDETFTYDEFNNIKEEKKNEVVPPQPSLNIEEGTVITTTSYDYEYDSHQNITKKEVFEKVKENDEEETITEGEQYLAEYNEKNLPTYELESNYDTNESKFIKAIERTMTYDGKNEMFKTKVETTYKESGEVQHGEQYTNEFNDKGQLVKQTILNLSTPESNAVGDSYGETTYIYDNFDNLKRLISIAYTETDHGMTSEIYQEGEYTYFNNEVNRPALSIESGYAKGSIFSGNTIIQKHDYDQNSRVTFYEKIVFNDSARSPETHDTFVYSYN